MTGSLALVAAAAAALGAAAIGRPPVLAVVFLMLGVAHLCCSVRATRRV